MNHLNGTMGLEAKRGIVSAVTLAIAAFFVVSNNATALTWTHENNGDPLKFLNSNNPTYTSTFNILNAGYDPNTMVVTAATAWFAFADDGDSQYEYVKVYLDGALFMGPIEVDGTHNNIPASYDWHSGTLSGSFLASLQDGIINYSVKVTSGDTYLKRTKLVAEGYARPSESPRVPEGGATIVMLGMSLAGLAGLARHRQSLLR